MDARLIIFTKVEAERLYTVVEKAIAEHPELLNTDESRLINEALEHLAAALSTEDRKKITAAKEALDKASVDFAGRRMDTSMADALKDQNIQDLVSPEVSS